MLRVGLIGVGRIGRLHAQHLATRVDGVQLLAVADVNEAAAQEVAARYNIPAAYGDYRRIVEDPNLDAVLICSSTDTHAPIIIESAAASKHIFCEKPIDHDLARIDAALKAVAEAGVKLQIGFNRRFDPNFARVRQGILSGEVGQVQMLHIISRDPAPPPIEYIRVSGGIFLDMTIHDFDMARFLIGSEVEEVYTAAGVMVDPAIGQAGDLDTALVMLKFANGVIGTIDNCRRAVYGYDQRVEVFGSGGSISSANNYANSITVQNGDHVRRDKPLYFFLERYTESFIRELQVFVDAVEQDLPVPVTGMDGRIPVLMGLAARRSYDENRPVRLTEVDNA